MGHINDLLPNSDCTVEACKGHIIILTIRTKLTVECIRCIEYIKCMVMTSHLPGHSYVLGLRQGCPYLFWQTPRIIGGVSAGRLWSNWLLKSVKATLHDLLETRVLLESKTISKDLLVVKNTFL